jgi:hypothetical protein
MDAAACIALLSELAQCAQEAQAASAGATAQELAVQMAAAVSLSPADAGAFRQGIAAAAAKPGFWERVAEEAGALTGVARALDAAMRQAAPAAKYSAAAVYSALVAAPGCPALGLLDALTYNAFLQLLKDTCMPKDKAAQADGAAPMDTDDGEFDGADAMATAAECIKELLSFVQRNAIKDYPDMLQLTADFVTDLVTCSRPAARAGARAGSKATCTVSDLAYSILGALFRPCNGGAQAAALLVFPKLSAVLVGAFARPGGGKKSAAQDPGAAKAAATQFVLGVLAEHPEAADAVAALAKHACLRCPDKADFRAAAVKAATALVNALQQRHRDAFVAFAHRLSRSTRVPQRMMAAEIARELLLNVAAPFARAAGYELYLAPGASPARVAPGASPRRLAQGLVPAPWSTTCLAILLGRCAARAAVLAAAPRPGSWMPASRCTQLRAHAQPPSRPAAQPPSRPLPSPPPTPHRPLQVLGQGRRGARPRAGQPGRRGGHLWQPAGHGGGHGPVLGRRGLRVRPHRGAPHPGAPCRLGAPGGRRRRRLRRGTRPARPECSHPHSPPPAAPAPRAAPQVEGAKAPPPPPAAKGRKGRKARAGSDSEGEGEGEGGAPEAMEVDGEAAGAAAGTPGPAAAEEAEQQHEEEAEEAEEGAPALEAFMPVKLELVRGAGRGGPWRAVCGQRPCGGLPAGCTGLLAAAGG